MRVQTGAHQIHSSIRQYRQKKAAELNPDGYLCRLAFRFYKLDIYYRCDHDSILVRVA